MTKQRKDQILITYKGETKNLKQWCEKLGISYSTAFYRWKKKWKIEEILKKTNKDIIHNGTKITLQEIFEIYGIKKTTFYSRLRAGWSQKEAIETPTKKMRDSEITEENKNFGPKTAFIQDLYDKGVMYYT